jgi:hypothetical protein
MHMNILQMQIRLMKMDRKLEKEPGGAMMYEIEFFKNFDKYWVGGHTDMEIISIIPDRTKTSKRKPKENTVITIHTHYVAPLK